MIGVIADDITGSNDIGVMFGKSGYIVDIYSYDFATVNHMSQQKPDVLVFDTDSRLDDERTAYDKVFKATKDIQKAGAVQFINKTCSVFRGNIGAEFDAMLDALGEEFAIVVLGFPKNGRQTLNSVHYVYGNKLEESQFKDDPIHPMNESDLVSILQSQTKRKVGAIHHKIIRQGSNIIKDEILRMKLEEKVQYVILDVSNQQDLFEIALAVHEEKVICGSSALAEEIPKVQKKQKLRKSTLSLPDFGGKKGIFCAAGSLMPQTNDQIEYMKKSENIVIELDTLALIRNNDQKNMINPLVEQIVTNINNGKHVILHSSNTKEKVKATKEEGAKRGWRNTEISRYISETIANITANVIGQTEQYRFVIAGGDTSATVCKALQIRGMRVWEEIQPGLPSCLSHTEPPYLFVLKSGSFGSPDFIDQAFDHLTKQARKEEMK
ncbi:four-carbon acid sugar kinase family protein [Halalkalibacter kiskunsagensis]|uniref:Four-carbon acid sugar kinase family protein n=1 Tax=Halalkalibacter kiskunsagensis TaxID=1548599 RepID=A0ABV6KGS6_9BACI